MMRSETFSINCNSEQFKRWMDKVLKPNLNQDMQVSPDSHKLEPVRELSDASKPVIYLLKNLVRDKNQPDRLIVPYTTMYLLGGEWKHLQHLPGGEAMVFDVYVSPDGRYQVDATCLPTFQSIFDEVVAAVKNYPDTGLQTMEIPAQIMPTRELLASLPGQRKKQDGNYKSAFWVALWKLYELNAWDTVVTHEELAELVGVAVGTINNTKGKYLKE